jgi:hypothetical protein
VVTYLALKKKEKKKEKKKKGKSKGKPTRLHSLHCVGHPQ